MKQIARWLAPLLVLGLWAAEAYAADHEVAHPWYSRTGVGLFIPQDNELDAGGADVDYETGFAISTSLGYRFSRYFAAEGEMAFGSAAVEDSSSDFGTLRWTLNGVAEYPDLELMDRALSPYAGLGIGLAWDKIDGADRAAAFAFQFQLGLMLQLDDRIWLGPSYRVQVDTFDAEGALEDDQISHVINLLNVRYQFYAGEPAPARPRY